MAGPTIARAEIQVDLDGRRIPGEAERMAREAGALAGGRFGEAWDKELARSVDTSLRNLAKRLESNGTFDAIGTTLRKKLTAPLLEARDAGRQATAVLGSRFRELQSSAESAFGSMRRATQDSVTELRALPAASRAAFDGLAADAHRSFHDVATDARISLGTARVEASRLAIDTGQALRNVATDARIALGGARVEASRFGIDAERTFKELGSGIRTAVDDVGNRAEQAFQRVRTSARDAFSGVSDGARREFSRAGDAARTLADNLRTRFTSAFGSVKTASADASGEAVRGLKEITTGAESGFGRAEQAQRSFTDRLRDGFNTGIGRAKEFARTLGTDTAGAIRDFARGATQPLGRLDQEFSKAQLAGDRFKRGMEGVFASIGDAFTRIFDRKGAGTRGAPTGFIDGIRNAFINMGTAAEGAGGKIRTFLNTAIDDTDKKAADGAGKHHGIGLWTAAIIGLIGLVATLGPEISALGSALGAFGVAAGSTFLAAVVGGLALKDAITGILSSVKDLPAAIQPAARAMQDFIGTINDKGKFTPSKYLHDLNDVFLSHAWQHMGGPVRDLAAALKGPLTESAADVGDALHKVTEAAADFFALPAGARVINDFFNTVEALLPSIGSALGAAGGAIVALFKESAPFTIDMLNGLTGMLNGFTKFAHTVQGDRSIDQWFANAKLILGHLFTALGDIGLAFHRMVTPDSIANLNIVLDAIGKTALALGQFMTAATPLGATIAHVLETISNALNALNPTFKSVFKGVDDLVTPVLTLVDLIVQRAAPLLNSVFGIIGKVLSGIGSAITAAMPDIKRLLTDVGSLLGGLAPGFERLNGEKLDGAQGALKGIVRVLDDVVTGLHSAINFVDSFAKHLGVVDGSKIGLLSKQLQQLTGTKYAIDLSPPSSSDSDWLGFLGDLEAHLTDFVVGTEVGLSQLFNMFSDLGKAVGDTAKIVDRVAHGDMKGAADAAKQLGKDMKSAFDNFNGSAALTTGQLRDMKNQIEDHINSFGLVGHAADHYISLLTQLPKSVKTQILLDDVNAGQKLSDFKATFAQLTKGQQVKLLLDASKAGQDLSAFRKTIEALPPSKQFQIIDNVAQAGGNLKGLTTVIQALPPSKQLKIITDAIAAGVPVKDLKTLIDGLKDKKVNLDVIDGAARAKAHGFQTLLDSIKQGLTPKLNVDPNPGEGNVKKLQSGINGIRQGKPPLLDVNPTPGKNNTSALQKVMNALKQGAKPTLDVNPTPGRNDTNALQRLMDGLKQGHVPSIVVNTSGAISSISGVRIALAGLTDRTVTVTTKTKTIAAANGGLFDYGANLKRFASGGVNGRDGMIATGGSNILWAEPETGWEAYISGKAGQSAANINTWMEAGRRLGVLSTQPSKTVTVNQTFMSPNADPQQVAAAAIDRLVPQL